MKNISRLDLSAAIAQLMPRIIQGVQLEFLFKQALTQTQFLVMVAIHSQGSCAMSNLARNMHVSMPTVSGVVDRLVKRNLIQRTLNDQDRRKVIVALSSKGKVIIKQFQTAMSQRWTDVLRNLGQSDIDSFYKIIVKLSKNLESEH